MGIHVAITMLDNFLAVGASLVSWLWLCDWRLAAFAVCLSPFVLTYLITLSLGMLAARRRGKGKLPPNIPYAVPFLGNLIPFVFNMCNFISRNRSRFGSHIPTTVRVLNKKIHLVSGRTHILSLFRASRDLGTAPSNVLILENLFGSPKTDRHVYERDDTGIHAEPLEGSCVLKSCNRIFYGLHRTLHANLAGPGLAELATRFTSNLKLELEANKSIGYEEWVEIEDLYSFIRDMIFRASTNALCGPHLLRLTPSFVADFWEFDSYSPKLFKDFPRWMIPKAYEVRDKLHKGMKKWHGFARDGYDWKLEDEGLWEEFFGAKVMRDRQMMFRAVEGMSDDAIAAVDLGMIWATNANVIPLIGFSLLDILLRPRLYSRVLSEIESVFDYTSESPPPQTGVPSLPSIDMTKLLTIPLLQSIYSEELRLRASVMVQRTAVVDNFTLGDGEWKLPKGDMILGSSWHEMKDREIWNDCAGEYSVDEFWSDRFLLYPNDPTSGPGRPKAGSVVSSKSKSSKPYSESRDRGVPQFSTEPVQGSFIPYGGGSKICPGRFYAKQEALGSLVLILKAFEVELKNTADLPKPNMEFFGFGVVQPVGKFPARVRRRKY